MRSPGAACVARHGYSTAPQRVPSRGGLPDRGNSKDASTWTTTVPRWRASTRRPPSPPDCKKRAMPPRSSASGTSGPRRRFHGTASPMSSRSIPRLRSRRTSRSMVRTGRWAIFRRRCITSTAAAAPPSPSSTATRISRFSSTWLSARRTLRSIRRSSYLDRLPRRDARTPPRRPGDDLRRR